MTKELLAILIFGGTYLLIWTIFTVYMFIASMRTSGEGS